MKICLIFFSFVIFNSCAKAKENNFTGSTPAGNVVKDFLGIPLADSVDFIRWNITLDNDRYHLFCHYGIGKPNTNGFINDGKKIAFKAELEKKGNYYQLRNGDKVLILAELNGNLLHIADNSNSLLTGNGGWSYTLNKVSPSATSQVNIFSQQNILKDSVAYIGRTPCKIPGIVPAGTTCYKLKWSIVLYAGAANNETGTYRMNGTPYYEKGGITGKWKIVTGKNNRIIYQLNDDNGKALIYLLKLDENILVFTDEQGNLLVGDGDFSYTLNSKW